MALGALHVHSAYSHDGKDALARIHDVACAAGLRFVAISDHAEDFDAARYREMRAECEAWSDARCRLIPGLEFRFAGFRGLHLLALGLSRWIEPSTPEAFIAETASGAAALTVLAHPVLPRYRVPEIVADRIDAVEVWNGVYNTRYLPDPRAMALVQSMRAVRPGVVAVTGQDQHDAANDRELRVSVAETEMAAPLAAIRAGHFRNHGRTMAFGPRIEWPALGLPALRLARLVFDGVERTQDRVTRAMRRRRPTTPSR